MTGRLRSLRRDQRGATIVEFALILAPLLVVLLGALDLGFQQYMAQQLQGTLDEAAREVTVGDVSQSQIQTLIEKRMRAIMPTAKITLTPKSFDNFSQVGKPEPITSDANGNGKMDQVGDCFLDVNGNGVLDSDAGSSGTGSGDDVVYYEATATYPATTPMGKLISGGPSTKITATMMMRNQPYAAQLPPHTVCK